MGSLRIKKAFLAFVVLLLAGSGLSPPHRIQPIAHAGDAPAGRQIHESVIAGSWYPASPAELRKELQGFLDRAPDPGLPGKLVGLISPHAGYAFSGQVAAYGYRLLTRQHFSTVIVIGPSHYARFNGVAVYDRGGFRTPLGVAPLDDELIAELEKRDSRIRYFDGAHEKEHSVEMQLPFLQMTLPEFKLVPLVMGEQDFEACRRLADAIADCIKDKPVLVVASSDLSHFHSYEQARLMDKGVMDKVAALDPRGLDSILTRGDSEACGGGPIITAMLIARRLGADTGRVLQSANSGDVTGDSRAARGGVVGYLSAALYAGSTGKPDAGPSPAKAGLDLGLTPDEKAQLHRIVRETIEARARSTRPPRLEPASGKLKEPRGAFVTLKKHGELRGCIGRIVADLPLVETISEMSVAAAFHDPRFPAVTADELKEINIEISVLTPLRKISDVSEIQVGAHGIYMRRGGRSGLLLPQVATEYGWDRTAFLENTCLKAGLPRNAWKDKETEIYIFSADIF